MKTLFISDLHLDASRPAVTRLFLDFLHHQVPGADALYILGDLFEAWIGDDDPDPHHGSVMNAIRSLDSTEVPVFFMHGNRDFLIGEGFAERTGCRLLDDPYVVDLYGIPTLLMHGDTLCIDDHEYQRFRKKMRNPATRQALLAKPLAERQAMARHLRSESRISNSMKASAIMDVNQHAVAAAMAQHNVTRLIHGHTHRPDVHHFKAGNREMTRIVLGDWHEKGSMLQVDASGYALEKYHYSGTS